MKLKILSFFFKKRSTVSPPTVTPVLSPIPPDRDSSTPRHSPTAEEIPQGATFGADYTRNGQNLPCRITRLRVRSVTNPVLGEAEIRAVEWHAFEVVRLSRSRKNDLAAINRIPPEVLALIPDFWSWDTRIRATVALTHVCQAWRKIFTSRSALWTDFDCENMDKTLVYLDRSGSSPIRVRLERDKELSPNDPFLQIVPHVTARLKSMTIRATPRDLQEITAHLSHSTPLLESLAIEAKFESSPQHSHVITTKLFGGDLSSLRELYLRCIRTELPWRNMVNLTSFKLGYAVSGDSSVGHLLDFFESAPRLRNIQLHLATPTFGAQNGRLVSLGCLKRMHIFGSVPPFLLFDHLLVPGGAMLVTEVESRAFPFPNIPESFGRIRELWGFRIHMHVRNFYPSIRFSGPEWEITIVPATPQSTPAVLRALESLNQFNPLQTERLRVAGGDLVLASGCPLAGVLAASRELRTLTISRCRSLSDFSRFLVDRHYSPKLEELILDPRVGGETFDIQKVIGVAAARRNTLKSIRIVSRDKSVQAAASKLGEYVSHVECSPRVALASDDCGSSNEED